MDSSRRRRVWARVFSLAWPVVAEQTFRTAMRTIRPTAVRSERQDRSGF
jgi:Na+-driven multidrug efflux pump